MLQTMGTRIGSRDPRRSLSPILRRMRLVFLALIVLTTACRTLGPLPPPESTACPPGVDVWTCIGEPDDEDRESGFTSTMRIAKTDTFLRFANQYKSCACDRSPRKGFTRIEWPAERGRAPLMGYFHEGAPGQPIIIVVHGLYDSNASKYIRVTADALATQSYGVLVPDMRWHGCLLNDDYLSTLGLEESHDLLHWAEVLHGRYGRPVGAVGYSLGALDVVLAMAKDQANVLDRGAIAISPPANLAAVSERLDREPSLSRDGRASLLLSYFRRFIRTRLREMHVKPTATPFSQYLAVASERDLLAAAEPSSRLKEVRGRLLIVTSSDDPVLGSSPTEAFLRAPKGPQVRVIATRDGGHIGHVGRYPRWISNTVARFFSAR